MTILKVRNLGVLQSFNCDLSKPFTILCGPNNSGKTYAATLLFGLYESLYKPTGTLDHNFLKELVGSDGIHDLQPLYKKYHESLGQAQVATLRENLPRLFGARDTFFKETELELISSSNWSEAMKRRCFFAFPKSQDNADFKSSFDEEKAQLQLNWSNGKEATPGMIEHLEHFFEVFIKDYLIGYRRPHFFPAERLAVDIFARDLTLNRSEYLNQSLLGKTTSPEPRVYSLPIMDNIRFMDTIIKASKVLDSEFADLARILEQQALDGNIRVSENNDLEFVTSDGAVLDPGLTSSLVKSLSGIVFYFKHVAYGRDFLLIDEPEANLHPKVQRLLARVLVRAVNQGIKVLISTHSETMLQEFNNMVMLSSEQAEVASLQNEYGYDKSETLKPDMLGLYVFGNGTGEELPVDQTGFDVRSIGDVIDQQVAASQDIYFRLFD